jgi:GNAT superfamily N-acetyltransferase
MTDWTIAIEAAPDADIRAAVLKPLMAHNTEQTGSSDYQPFAITIRGPDGSIAGGLYGGIYFRFLFIELLATGAAKDQGIGRQVMELAEAEARKRGCIGMWLDTFTFQAPWFYPKLGFTEFGRIPDYPPGHDRIFLVKRFE